MLRPPVAAVTHPPVLATGTALYTIPSNVKNETIYEGNLSIEYQSANTFLLDVGYAGNRSRHLLAERQLGTGNNGNGPSNGLGGDKTTNGSFGRNRATCFLTYVRTV